MRLIVGDFQAEKPLTVRVEPALEPYLLNMKAGYQFALEALEMIQKLNRAAQTLSTSRPALQNLRQTARQQGIRLPEAVSKALEQHEKTINELEARIDNPNTGLAYARGCACAGGSTRSTPPSPATRVHTQAQITYFNEVKAEFEALYAQIQDYLQKQAAALNETLKTHNLPIVLVGGNTP